MQYDQQASPLPPDPAGREDIMSPQPQDGARGDRQASPLPPDVRTHAREDIIEDQPPR